MTCARAILPLIFGLILAAPASGGAPGQSLRPLARPTAAEISRPDAMVLVTQAAGVQISLRPLARPAQFREAVVSPPVWVAATARGSVCNRRDIQGQKLARIRGTLGGCGVSSPVQVTSVAGVDLSQPATMDCRTAKALNKWVKNGVKPIIGRLGGGVSSLQVVAHYSCRTRNSRPGARISEHGKGHAIDISAINLNNGASVTVLRDWNKRAEGRLLKQLQRAACGPFGTVLGPNADRFHQDHFHLDTARGRGGSYCRYTPSP